MKPAVCGVARPARRSARPRQGRARRIQDRRRIRRTAPAAAEAKLFEIALRQKRDEISQADALRELETLSVMWRGDGIEVRALEMMAQPLCRCRTLRRIAGGGADRDQAASPIRKLARQGQDAASALFAQTLPGIEGRRSAAGRRARAVLRISRIDADRPARRRNDPPARRPAGRGRSARSGQRTPAIPGRSPAGGRRARAGRGAAGDGLSDQPQAGSRHRRASHHADRRSLRRIAPAAAAAGGARAKRRRPS